jgi:regulator of sigma E protease
MTTFVAFVIVLAACVIVHEFGHFVAARWFGVRVLTFSFGIGPKLLRIRRGATEYCVGALPLGGYVKLAGASGLDLPVSGDRQPDELFSKSRWARLTIYLAGPVASLALGVAGLSVSFFRGSPIFDSPASLIVERVVAQSAAHAAGLRAGDTITGTDGMCFLRWEDLWAHASSAARPVTLVVEHGGVARDVMITAAGYPSAGAFGLIMRPAWMAGEESHGLGLPLEENPPSFTPAQALDQSLRLTAAAARQTAVMVVETVSGNPPPADDLTGPVGIAWISGRAAAHLGWLSLIDVIGILSLGLGLFNLLPVPPLDGGHIAVLGFEGIRGRDLGPRARVAILLGGVVIVLGLLALGTWADVLRIMRS